MGLRTVAVYSDADAREPFVGEADVAVRIGPAPARDSYLAIDRIVAAARETGASLVHPGYGFLAEDGRFDRQNIRWRRRISASVVAAHLYH